MFKLTQQLFFILPPSPRCEILLGLVYQVYYRPSLKQMSHLQKGQICYAQNKLVYL
jgi:hypothetical protein